MGWRGWVAGMYTLMMMGVCSFGLLLLGEGQMKFSFCVLRGEGWSTHTQLDTMRGIVGLFFLFSFFFFSLWGAKQ